MQLPKHDRAGLVSLGWSLLDETVSNLNDAGKDERSDISLRVERQIDLLDRMLGRAEAGTGPVPPPSGTDAFDGIVADLDGK